MCEVIQGTCVRLYKGHVWGYTRDVCEVIQGTCVRLYKGGVSRCDDCVE